MSDEKLNSGSAHPLEIPHHVPHDGPWARVAWNAVAAVEMFFVSLLLGLSIEMLYQTNGPKPDRWVDTTVPTVLDIRTSAKRWPLLVGDDDLELHPTTRDWEGGGCSGDVHCTKGRYSVGTFDLKKQPGNLNGLQLVISYEDGREVIAKLTRTK